MGVSGCGKSTVARTLAAYFDVTFVEGDNLHAAAAVQKMARGEALNDDDRMPWLGRVGETLAQPAAGAVASCSALRRRYRDALRGACPGAFFLHLDVPAAALEERLQARRNHFMPPSLLRSQLVTLEPLDPDETGAVIPAGYPEVVIAEAIRASMVWRESKRSLIPAAPSA